MGIYEFLDAGFLVAWILAMLIGRTWHVLTDVCIIVPRVSGFSALHNLFAYQ